MSRGTVWHLCRGRNGELVPRERDEEGQFPLHAAGCGGSSCGTWALAARVPTHKTLPDGTVVIKTKTQLKRAGFPRLKDAEDALEHIELLLAEERHDLDVRASIGDLIVASRGTLPSVEEVRRRIGAGLDPGATPPTLGEWLDEWLATKVTKRPNTQGMYRARVEHYLKPHLGHIRLDRLRVADVARMFAWIEARNAVVAACRPEGSSRIEWRPVPDDPLDPRTTLRACGPVAQAQVRLVLLMALKGAVEEGKIARNPLVSQAGRDLLTEYDVPERKAWAPEVVREFIAAAEGDRLHAAFRLVLEAGLRRGELHGLRWKNVHLDERYLKVDEQLAGVTRDPATGAARPVFGPPKTKKSRREVPLTPGLVAVLRAHREVQELERRFAEDAYVDHDLVICSEDGAPYPLGRISDRFQRLARDAGLPIISLHEGRHTLVTLLMEAGVDVEVVSGIVGHSSTQITTDVYTHVRRVVRKAAADKLEAFMMPPVDSEGA
jgi:integrase